MGRESRCVGLIACMACGAPPQPHSHTSVEAVAAGCYTMESQTLPKALRPYVPDSLALQTNPSPLAGSLGHSALTVQPTGSEWTGSGVQMGWWARGDSLWLVRVGNEDGDEFRLTRAGDNWNGVLVHFTDVVVPDSALPRWPVKLLRRPCASIR